MKFLYVGLYRQWSPDAAGAQGTGWSSIVARPVRDVAADLQLAHLLSGMTGTPRMTRPARSGRRTSRTTLTRSVKDPAATPTLWSWADHFSVYFDRMRTQTAVLARADVALLIGLVWVSRRPRRLHYAAS